MFTLWSMNVFPYICVCVTSCRVYFFLDGLYETFWLHIADSRKGRKTKDECPRDKREEEEDCREDTEMRKQCFWEALISIATTIAYTTEVWLWYRHEIVWLFVERCVSTFQADLNLQKWAKNPIDRHWKRDWVRMKNHNRLLHHCHRNVYEASYNFSCLLYYF